MFLSLLGLTLLHAALLYVADVVLTRIIALATPSP
jgi:hypothetical protein